MIPLCPIRVAAATEGLFMETSTEPKDLVHRRSPPLVCISGVIMSAKVAQSIAIVSGGSPADLVVCALDRDEYTIASSGSAGSFSVNGHTRPGVHRLATGRFAAPAFVARLNRLEITML